jgi:hypothetical protein
MGTTITHRLKQNISYTFLIIALFANAPAKADELSANRNQPRNSIREGINDQLEQLRDELLEQREQLHQEVLEIRNLYRNNADVELSLIHI